VSDPDVVALGETMLSVVAVDGPLERATSFVATHGGAESNVCVGLARRGHAVAWVSALGEDQAGDRVATALAIEGVDLRWSGAIPDARRGSCCATRSAPFGTTAAGPRRAR